MANERKVKTRQGLLPRFPDMKSNGRLLVSKLQITIALSLVWAVGGSLAAYSGKEFCKLFSSYGSRSTITDSLLRESYLFLRIAQLYQSPSYSLISKRLCQGCLVHFLYNANNTSLFAMEL